MTRVGWLRLGIIGGAIGLLEILCRAGAIKKVTMVPPSDMVLALGQLLAKGELLDDIGRTLSSVAIAGAIAVAGGILLGIGLHALPRFRRAVEPMLASWYAVPFFIFYPLLVGIFGLSDAPIIVVAVLFAIVAMIVNTLNGLDRVTPVLRKVARVHRLSAPDTVRRILLPAIAPHLLTGFKLATAYSFIGVIASEFILSTSGLGFAIAHAYNNFETRKMYALMLLIIVLVTAINTALFMWEQRLLRRRFNR